MLHALNRIMDHLVTLESEAAAALVRTHSHRMKSKPLQNLAAKIFSRCDGIRSITYMPNDAGDFILVETEDGKELKTTVRSNTSFDIYSGAERIQSQVNAEEVCGFFILNNTQPTIRKDKKTPHGDNDTWGFEKHTGGGQPPPRRTNSNVSRHGGGRGRR